MFKKTVLISSAVLLTAACSLTFAANSKNIAAKKDTVAKQKLIKESALTKTDKNKKTITSKIGDNPGANIISNAFNYESSLPVSINPRTLMLSVTLPLAALGDQNGPSVNFALGYQQHNNYQRYTIPGFSGSMPLGIALPYIDTQSITPYAGTIHLPNGGSYQLETPETGRMQLHQYSLNDTSVYSVPNGETAPDGQTYYYDLSTLNGEVYYFDSWGTLVCINKQVLDVNKQPVNHYISFKSSYDQENKQSTLNTITTSGGLSISFTQDNYGTNIILPGNRQISVSYQGVTYSIYNYPDTANLAKFQLTKIEFNPNDLNEIEKITYPTGLTRDFGYSSYTNTNGQLISYVSSDITTLNGKQIVTKYAPLGSNTFLGDCSGSADDCLMNESHAYNYQTQITSGGVATVNTYNHLHLLTQQTMQTNTEIPSALQDTQYVYSGEDGDNFDSMSYADIAARYPNYQKPATTTQTTYATPSQLRTLYKNTAYDAKYNQLLEKAANNIVGGK